MKRVWKIVGATLFWCVIVAYLVFASLLRAKNEQQRTVERVEVVVDNADNQGLISPEKVLDLLNQEGLYPVGKSVESVELTTINQCVEEYCFIARAKTYIDYRGTLTIEVRQREPVMRYKGSDGYDFYLTANGYVLPVEPHATFNLPIVTGDVELPFGKSFEGSLREWLAEGEKKYQESYKFLTKLINFVVYLEESEWEGGKCVQINLVTPKKSKGKKEGYNEPQIELIPRNGDYLVEIGRLEQIEEKIYRWRRFVESAVVDMSGGTLCVEYDNQALWKEAQKSKKIKKK